MVELLLTVGAFTSLLGFVVVVLHYELDLSMLVSVPLGVSVLSMGFMVAVGLQMLAGMSMLLTTVALGAVMFVAAGTYELVS